MHVQKRLANLRACDVIASRCKSRRDGDATRDGAKKAMPVRPCSEYGGPSRSENCPILRYDTLRPAVTHSKSHRSASRSPWQQRIEHDDLLQWTCSTSRARSRSLLRRVVCHQVGDDVVVQPLSWRLLCMPATSTSALKFSVVRSRPMDTGAARCPSHDDGQGQLLQQGCNEERQPVHGLEVGLGGVRGHCALGVDVRCEQPLEIDTPWTSARVKRIVHTAGAGPSRCIESSIRRSSS